MLTGVIQYPRFYPFMLTSEEIEKAWRLMERGDTQGLEDLDAEIYLKRQLRKATPASGGEG